MNKSAPAKIGATHGQAMIRSGLKELTQILPAFPDSIKPIEEPGLSGNALPQEVFRDRHGPDLEHEQHIEMQM